VALKIYGVDSLLSSRSETPTQVRNLHDEIADNVLCEVLTKRVTFVQVTECLMNSIGRHRFPIGGTLEAARDNRKLY
jgi:hypothetical protein